MKFTEKDKTFMTLALALAKKAKGSTFPNPAVGAVIVNSGAVVGKGATATNGVPHAEICALKKAGNRAVGADLFVTLEPCNHFGKSPPCTTAIIASGIKRVVMAITDPNPLVSGSGIKHLRKNGIVVEQGLLREEAYTLNEDFFWTITKKSPWVTLKLALTLDGKIADHAFHSRWITSAASRSFVHDLRRQHQAIAVGHATIKIDDPKLTVRHTTGRDPVRIVFSTSPKLGATSYFVQNANFTRSIVVVAGKEKLHKKSFKNGIEFWYTGQASLEKSIPLFLKMAYAEGITSVFVEGGQKLASAFLECGRVNRLYLFYGNVIIGGGLDGFSFKKYLPLENAVTLQRSTTKIFGADFMISGIPVWK